MPQCYNEIMRKTLMYLCAWGVPAFALAAGGSGETVQTLLGKIGDKIITPLMNFLIVLATLVFLWGIIQYVIAGDSADKTGRAKRQIIWGLVGLAVMGSAWAIVNVVESTVFGL